MAVAATVLSAVVAWRAVVVAVSPPSRSPSVAALLDGPGGSAERPATSEPPAPDEAAVARARAALRDEPLSAEALVVLALAADRAGEPDRALRLMRLAAARWPREFTAQTWLLALFLRRGDPRTAMVHLDAIGRGRPEALEDLIPALEPLGTDPSAGAALADMLASDPPWRALFFPTASRRWRPEAQAALLGRLQERPPGPTVAELRLVLTRLVAAGLVDQAYLAWLRSLSGDRKDLAFLYNGGFLHPITDMPFDWVRPPVASATVSVVREGDAPSLVVGFLGGRVSGPPLLHDLVLAPGDYRLTGRVRTDRLRTERGVRWRISCREDPDRTLAASEPAVGTAPWRDFGLDFTVPDGECGSQILGLEIDAPTSLDRQASGVAVFSALDIRPR